MGRLTDTISGGIATFRTPGKQSIRHLKAYFSPRQEGTGTPSPDNVRAIVPWDGVTVYQRGKNLCDAATGTEMVEKWNIDSDSSSRTKPYPNFPTGQNFTLSCRWTRAWDTSSNRRLYLNGNRTSGVFISPANDGPVSKSVTNVPSTTNAKGLWISHDNRGLTYGIEGAEYAASLVDVQLELGSTPTPYEPYQGTDQSVVFPLPVYGGYVDLVTGEVWETGIFAQDTWGNMTSASVLGDYERRRITVARASRGEYIIGGGTQGERKCNVAPWIYNYTLDAHHYYSANNGYAYVFLPVGTSDDTIVQVYSPLETPLLVATLTPTELRTFLGTNNIWCNAGDVEVEYDFAESREIIDCKRRLLFNDSYHLLSASGRIVTFNTPMTRPLKECRINFSPVQSGTGTPNLENIMPIVGYDSIDVHLSGKNLVTEDLIIPNYFVRGAVTQSGTEIGAEFASTGFKCTDFIRVLPNTVYTISFSFISASAAGVAFYRGPTTESVISGISTESMRKSPYTFTTPADCEYLRFSARKSGTAFMSLVQGEIALTEEPWQGETTPIIFPSTVYGGWVDLITGEVWANGIFAQDTWGNMTSASVLGDYERRRITVARASRGEYIIGGGTQGERKCNVAPWIYNYTLDAHHYYSANNGYAYVFLPVGTSDDTIVQVYSPLETPLLITTLTPTELHTFKGTNNIWSNANGDISIKYWTH